MGRGFSRNRNVVLYARVSLIVTGRGGNIRLGLVVYSFVVLQSDLYRENIPLSLVGVLQDPEDEVLVAKSFARLCCLSKLVGLESIALLMCWLALRSLHGDVCAVAVVAAIGVYTCICTIIRQCAALICCTVIVLVAIFGNVIVELNTVYNGFKTVDTETRTVFSVAIVGIVEVSRTSRASFLVSSIALCLFCIAQRIFACFAL
jgi:hypothetical protein